MVGCVHITKDKDVMTVIPKMIMMLYYSASVRVANNQVSMLVLTVEVESSRACRAESRVTPLQTQQRGVAGCQGWSGLLPAGVLVRCRRLV